jgi:hypothetical protein
MLTTLQQIENTKQANIARKESDPESQRWIEYRNIIADIIADTAGINADDLISRADENAKPLDRLGFLFDSLANENPLFVKAITKFLPSPYFKYPEKADKFQLTQMNAYLPAIVQAVYWDIHISRDRGVAPKLVSETGEVHQGLINQFFNLPINHLFENSPNLAYELLAQAKRKVRYNSEQRFTPYTPRYGEVAHQFTAEMAQTVSRLLARTYRYALDYLPDITRGVVVYDLNYYVSPIAYAIGAGVINGKEHLRLRPTTGYTTTMSDAIRTADPYKHCLQNTSRKFCLDEDEMYLRKDEFERVLGKIVVDPVRLAHFKAVLERNPYFASIKPHEIEKVLEATMEAISSIRLEPDRDFND